MGFKVFTIYFKLWCIIEFESWLIRAIGRLEYTWLEYASSNNAKSSLWFTSIEELEKTWILNWRILALESSEFFSLESFTWLCSGAFKFILLYANDTRSYLWSFGRGVLVKCNYLNNYLFLSFYWDNYMVKFDWLLWWICTWYDLIC